MRLRGWIVLACALVSSGCVEEDADEYQFGGWFDEQASQSDIEDFRDRMMKHGAKDVLILESFPPQFTVTGLGAGCEAARTEASGLPYVRSANACRVMATSDGGDEPTGTTNSAP